MTEEETGYLKLVGKDFNYVLVEHELMLGRKQKAAKPGFFALGTAKNISRKHAGLKWDPDNRSWVIQCLGKNGLEVDNVHYGMDHPPIKLRHKAKVDIGDASFFVLLPNQP
eukprot:gb/GEZN01019223.1/.p1 GENE.gb/GEZN01019223.1/~~gb/GEZN01019223.1/.p1  ORF type:complete len:111 (+),score=12.53 gb/GEZN01019223.1/:87-419(+)